MKSKTKALSKFRGELTKKSQTGNDFNGVVMRARMKANKDRKGYSQDE